MRNMRCPKQKLGSVHCGYYACSMMSNTTTYRRHPYRVSLNLFNLFICSLCLDMLTVFIYAHYFYICSLFSYMLTVFIYAHCVQICPLFLDMPKLIFLQQQDEKGVRNDPHKDDNLLELVGDLCAFILDQIIHVRDNYHDRKSELGRHPQQQHLHEPKRLDLGR